MSTAMVTPMVKHQGGEWRKAAGIQPSDYVPGLPLQSRKPAAEAFKRWVDTVLESLCPQRAVNEEAARAELKASSRETRDDRFQAHRALKRMHSRARASANPLPAKASKAR